MGVYAPLCTYSDIFLRFLVSVCVYDYMLSQPLLRRSTPNGVCSATRTTVSHLSVEVHKKRVLRNSSLYFHQFMSFSNNLPADLSTDYI